MIPVPWSEERVGAGEGLVYLPVLLPPLRKDMKAVTVAPGTAGRRGWRRFPSRTQRSGSVLAEALAVGIRAFRPAPDEIKVVGEFCATRNGPSRLGRGHAGVIRP
jgi:hypothetical protein